MGFEMKKSNETNVAKDFQSSVLQMVARGETEMNVTKYAKNMYNKILKGDVEVKDIAHRRRLRSPLEEYKNIGGGTAGVYYHNIYLNNEPINVGDSYYYYVVDTHAITGHPLEYEIRGKIRKVEYIAAKNIEDIESNFPAAWDRIADAEIVRKINLIYDSMEWDISNVSSIGIQKKLDEWW
jgi:DNA polymerase elongation subunit (family B)